MTGSFADNEPYGILQMYVCAPRLESGEGRHQAAPPSLLHLRDYLHCQQKLPPRAGSVAGHPVGFQEKTIVSHDCYCYCVISYLKVSSGLICTREQVMEELEADYAGYSVKPKMMVITSSLLFIMAITFLYNSALRAR